YQNIMLRVLDNNGGMNDDDTKFYFNYDSRNDWCCGSVVEDSAPPEAWHNFTIAYNANSDTVSTFQNGVVTNEYIRTDKAFVAGDRIRMGAALVPDWQFDAPFSGYMDDFVFYDRALNANQLQDLFAGNTPEFTLSPDIDTYTVNTLSSSDISTQFTIPEGQASGRYVYSQLAEAALDIPDQRSVQLDPAIMVHFDEPQGSVSNLFIYPEDDSYCNGGCPTLVEDFAGLAAEFDGTTGHAYGFGPNSWSEGAWAMSAWIYPTHSDSSVRGIIGSNQHNAPILYITADDKLGFSFHNGSSWNSNYTPGGSIERNRWNQVGMTYDGAGNFQAYLNGEPVGGDAAIAGSSASLLTYHFIGSVGGSYQPFKGRIDNVALYDQLLSDGQMRSLHGTTDLSLHLHYTLDEPPGNNTFVNSAGIFGDATCSGASCPTLGIRGPVNRAAYFDGDQINSLLNAPEHWRNHYQGAAWTVAFWLKAEHGRVIENKGIANPFRIYTNSWDYSRGCDTCGWDDSTNVAWNAPSTEWTHIIISVDNDNYSAGGVFVNGEKVSGTGTSIEWDPFGNAPFRIGSGALKGFVDDVRFYGRVFSNDAALNLFEETRPVYQLEFEEDETATILADQSANEYSGTLVNAIPGLAGRIGNGLNFDGDSYVDSGVAVNINTITESMTIMTWVRPDQGVSGQQLLVGSGLENSANGFGFGINGQQLWFSDGSTTANSGNIGLASNSWQMVGVKVGSDGTVSFFLNGEPVGNQGSVSLAANNDDNLYLGGRPQADGQFGQFFYGQLDELFIYNRALPLVEIGSAYDNQFRWFRQQIDTQLIVDNDVPTITLQTTQTHWPNSYIQLAVGTDDASSAIWSFEMGLQGPSDGSMSWQAAQSCADAEFGAVWCPGFDPSLMDGEGAYQLQFRAVDTVGNETTSSIYTVYVDDTAPVLNHTEISNGWEYLIGISGQENGWTIPVYGTIQDTGAATASGPDPNSVSIQLYDAGGNPLGEPQYANVFGGGWSIDYELFGHPQGHFAVQITGSDRVGNSATTTINSGTFRADGRPPSLEIDEALGLGQVISQPLTFSGFATESPLWGDSLASYFFEEEDGSTIYDLSGNDNHATCTSCPTHVSGQFGQALQFDGANDSVIAPTLFNPATTTFSIALWFNADSSTVDTNSRHLVFQGNGDGPARSMLYLDGNNKIRSNLGYGNTGTFAGGSAITHDSWHHAALTYDGTNARLYRDGILLTTFTAEAELSRGQLYLGSSADGSQLFKGSLDDLQIFDRVLSNQEIVAMAGTESRGIYNVQTWLEPFDFYGVEATPDWQDATLDNQSGHFSDWEQTLPTDLEGFYQVNLRSFDTVNNESPEHTVWRGIIDHITPTVSISAKHLGAGSAAYTEITFSAADQFLDLNNLSLPCGEES
ncbi:MAG: LamG-like jellyroll fold domain-containing protein, partial [Chloroflexota bacterium]